MPDSVLSFANSATFRDTLLARNLPPYTVTGVYSSPPNSVNYETNLTVSNVINSPDEFISQDPFAQQLYPLNQYGPDGGYNIQITYNNPPLPVSSNSGEYDPNDTKLDLVNEFFIDAAYIENVYGPNGGFQNMVTITSIQNNNRIYAPYWDPPTFIPSSYSPYTILLSNDPTGSDGLLSQDSYLAKISAQNLKDLFKARVDAEIYQNTVGLVNLESLSDPFEASLIATGREPLIYRDYRITVPEFPLLNAFDFATRLASAYWPVSFIPGDYFNENVPNAQSQQVSNALNVVNQLTGGFLGPILNFTRNPSEIFLANTGNAQRSFLFKNIDYNRYQPSYNKNFGGLLGVAQGLVNLAVSLINPQNGTLIGGYYVGSRNAEPSTITSPPNQIPVDPFGRQNPSPVYGPSELGQLYEGNIGQLNFGLAGKSTTDGGSLDGGFVWVSPKYKSNAGFKATPGGGTGSKDDEFNQISSNYERDESTNLTFKQTSILDQTQRLVDSADNVQGISRLKHVGNAINQVSKVFNDGYKELTKGSQVVSYIDNTTGGEKGIEYCRLFAKDTPYYTYADLQKRDGITTSGRRFTNSVLDNTYNLNIAPLRNPGSTNIVAGDPMGKGGYAKKYMFSIENLAWRTSSRPGYTYDELPICEKGPNGGRVMWFPPYDLKFTDTSSANWNAQSFLGRPEPIYTYKDTSRSGTLSWKIIVDHPSVMNVIVEQQLKGKNKERLNSIIDSFFAGCVKFDIYELAKKFNTIPVKDLYTYQEILNDPRLTPEQLRGVQKEIPAENTANNNGQGVNTNENNSGTVTVDPSVKDFESKYTELAFYFENDIPKTGDVSYLETYNTYTTSTNISKYQSNADSEFNQGNTNRNTTDFFNNVVISNFKQIALNDKNFITDLYNILDKKLANVTLILEGSASAPAKVNYNKSLSDRRISSVTKFLKEYKGKGDVNLAKFIDKTLTITNFGGTGEKTVIPYCESGTYGSDVNCTQDIKNKNNTVTSQSQIYSISAMACRRVKMIIRVDPVVLEKPKEPEQTTSPKTTITGETINTPKPQPTITIQQKLKEGISKKILRQLLSECDYFEVIKEENPFIYDSIKEKIKYFNPAFHSMTPEGLNARLTFLNQCLRPGETLPIIGVDGKPRINDAVNTSFGAPPVLVLRVGDFYHTKIIPKSFSFSYDPLTLDMNPEGIGIQPMVANVTMNFDIIGGMGLAKPVEQLQNALSFNYYANTEIYDERAVWTEDTSALDKKIVDSLLNGEVSATKKDVVNQQPNDGGTTIGEIVTNIPVASGQTGEMSYQKIMDGLLDKTKNYYINTVNQIEIINNNTENGNYGLVQLVNQSRIKTDWSAGTSAKLVIYGKPDQYQNEINKVFNNIDDDITASNNRIIQFLLEDGFNQTTVIDGVKANMKTYIKSMSSTFSNNIGTIIQNLTENQIDLINTVSKLNLVYGAVDGFLLEGNKPRVYNLSGTPITDTNSSNSLIQLQTDFVKIVPTTNKFNDLVKAEKIIDQTYNGGDYLIDSKVSSNIKNVQDKRFFLVMSRIFNNKNKLDTFKKEIIKGYESEKKPKNLKNRIDKICDEMAKDYGKVIEFYEKKFKDFKKNNQYLDLTEGLEDIDEMYVKGKPRRMNYSTVSNDNNKTNGDKLLSLYVTNPVNKQFNG
jgi:hypothetical protein